MCSTKTKWNEVGVCACKVSFERNKVKVCSTKTKWNKVRGGIKLVSVHPRYV